MNKILITGATGLVGQKLVKQLFLEGHTHINILTRDPITAQKSTNFPVSFYEWDLKKETIDKQAFENVDTVIHLAGENIADGRWSEQKKKRIIDSRVISSKLIAKSIKEMEKPPSKIISTSAIGYYGDCAGEELTEQSELGSGFLAEVCHLWEDAIKSAELSCDTYFIRIGMVISKDGGAISKMELPFKAGVAGKLGDGSQYMSWIHIDDLVSQFIYLLNNAPVERTFNAVSPNPVTNSEFTKTMGRILKRPTLIPAPKAILKLALGEMSDVLLNSQRVLPQNFIKNGFKFRFPDLEKALEEVFFYDLRGEKKLYKVQYVSHPRDKVFAFFKNEHNLEKITPPLLNFKVLGKNTEKIQEGTIIDYQLKLRGIPIRWKSLIKDFVQDETFTDQQLNGPYKKWVHTHGFISVNEGTLMTDNIIYKVPFGLLGRIIAGSYVARDVDKIFKYRQEIIGDVFDDEGK